MVGSPVKNGLKIIYLANICTEHHTDAIVSFKHTLTSFIYFDKLLSDVELGDGSATVSATQPRIYMLSCELQNCKNVEVKVAAQAGSIYMIYREQKVKVGSDYKEAPIAVSIC